MVRVFLHFSLKADLKFSSLFTVKIITDFLCHSRKSSWRGTRKSLAILKVALLKEMFCDQLTTRIMTRNITSLMSDAFNCRDHISFSQESNIDSTDLSCLPHPTALAVKYQSLLKYTQGSHFN